MSIIKEIGPVKDYITGRQNSSKSSKWNNGRKTWAVFYGTDASKIGLESNQIDPDFNTPLPGIDSISVKFKGSLGSLREVTVNYTCWTNDQLAAMSKAYMQLGRTVAVYFGWSITDEDDRVTINTDKTAKDPLKNFNTNIKKSVTDNRGCVAGYKGLVDNFEFSLNDNGSYSCMCHFITPGEAALDVNTDVTTKGKNVKAANEDGEEKNQSNLVKAILALRQYVISEEKSKAGDWFTVTLQRERDQEEKENQSFIDSTLEFFGNTLQDTDTVYVSWGYIEDEIINKTIFPINKEGERVYTIDSTDIEISNDVAVHALDPLIAHIPGKSALDDYSKSKPLDGLPSDKWDGQLRTLYINVNYLLSQALQSVKLQDFLNSLLNSLNSACNHKFSLSAIVDDEDPSLLKIVDSNHMISNGISSYVFNMYGVNSICKSVSLSTSVPTGIKAELMYGANSSKDSDSNVESAEFSFQPGKDELTPSNTEQEQTDESNNNGKNNNTAPDPEKTYADALNTLINGIESTTIDSVKSAFNRLPVVTTEVKTKKEETDPNVLVPLGLSFDLDGIEGIPYGSLIQGNFIPGVYKEYADFMITGVSHELSPDEWKTSIETVMRRKQP